MMFILSMLNLLKPIIQTDVDNLLDTCRQVPPDFRYLLGFYPFAVNDAYCRQACYNRPTSSKPLFHNSACRENIQRDDNNVFSSIVLDI